MMASVSAFAGKQVEFKAAPSELPTGFGS